MDASKIIDKTEVGQLTSPLFPQEREVSANPFLRHWRPVRGVESCSNVEKPLWKVNKIVNWRVCNFLKWKRRRILSEQKSLHEFLEKEAYRAFQGPKVNLRLRPDYLTHKLNWTEENGKDEMLILLFMKLADSSNLRGWSSVKRIICLIKLKGKRAGYL